MWYIITAIISGAIGCLLMGVVAGSKMNEERNDAYIKGHDAGVIEGREQVLPSPVKQFISVEHHDIIPIVAELVVPSDEAFEHPEEVREAVKRELNNMLVDGIKDHAKYTEIYDPVYQRMEYRAMVKIAKRRD